MFVFNRTWRVFYLKGYRGREVKISDECDLAIICEQEYLVGVNCKQIYDWLK